MQPSIEIDISDFVLKMKNLSRDFPSAARQFMREVGYKTERLARRKGYIPIRSGHLRRLTKAEWPRDYVTVITSKTDYAEAMEKMYGFQQKAADDIRPEIPKIADRVFGAWSK